MSGRNMAWYTAPSACPAIGCREFRLGALTELRMLVEGNHVASADKAAQAAIHADVLQAAQLTDR